MTKTIRTSPQRRSPPRRRAALTLPLLREPDLVARMTLVRRSRVPARTGNTCVPSIYAGTRCVLDHPAPLQVI
jgi:hypothetical protein